jgi:hypothetical protein
MADYSEVLEFLELLNVDEEEALSALLSAFGPPQPGALRGAWKKNAHFGNAAPTTKEFWNLFTDSQFKCSNCGSRLRLTVDHIDGDGKNHAAGNLQVLCFSCNRKRIGSTAKGRANVNIYRAAMKALRETGSIPRNRDVAKSAGGPIGGATYLLKFLRCLPRPGAKLQIADEDLDIDEEADNDAEKEAETLGCEHVS